jgi:(R,R)-butanediol dehydrogenase / meso-butanediol dehydrogenase / diacetyl reductase
MKALRFHAAKDLRVEDIPLPSNPADDEVVIKNRFAGICGTDLHEYAYGPIFVPKNAEGKTAAPQVLGHEYGGTVTKVGKNVTHVKVGERVSVQPFITPRGGDYYADLGHYNLSDNLRLAGLSWIGGGMASESLLKGFNVYKVPDNMTDEDAALVELVTGAGPIGLLTLLAARAAGAVQLFVSDPNATRLRIAKDILPDVVTINPREQNVGDVIRAATEGNVGCDVALECVGNTLALQACIDAVRKRGTVVQIGLHAGEAPVNWFNVTYKDIDLRGSWAYSAQMWPRVMRLVASGQIPAHKVVTKTVTLDTVIKDGFDALLDPAGTQLKILIDLGG